MCTKYKYDKGHEISYSTKNAPYLQYNLTLEDFMPHIKHTSTSDECSVNVHKCNHIQMICKINI